MQFSANDETIRFIEHAFNAVHGLGCTAEFCDAAYDLTHIDENTECGVVYNAKWQPIPEAPGRFRA